MEFIHQGAGSKPAPAIHILFVLVFIFAAVSPSRADMIAYGEIIRDALQHSARIRVKAEDIRISDAVYRQNFAGLYPEISAVSRFEKHENLDYRNNGINTINGEVIGGDTSAWRSGAYLTGQYYISHWYKKRFEAAYFERLVDVRGHERDIEIKKVLREATDAFSALAEGKIKLLYAAEILKRLQDLLRLKKAAFAGGQAAYEEVLKLEADVAALEKETGTIRKEFRENLERLCSYTGRAYQKDTDIKFLAVPVRKPSGDYAGLVEATPEYKARLKEMEAVKFKAKAVSNNFWPDISLYGRYDFYGSNPDSWDATVRDFRQSAYTAGVMISLPIFDGGVRKWDRKRNLYEIKKQDEAIKAVMGEKGRDIKTLHAGYDELSKTLVHYRKLAAQYEKMLDITKKARGLGERSLMDLMEMEKEALTVERDRKVTEHSLAAAEMRMALETDFKSFMRDYDGDRAGKY